MMNIRTEKTFPSSTSTTELSALPSPALYICFLALCEAFSSVFAAQAGEPHQHPAPQCLPIALPAAVPAASCRAASLAGAAGCRDILPTAMGAWQGMLAGKGGAGAHPSAQKASKTGSRAGMHGYRLPHPPDFYLTSLLASPHGCCDLSFTSPICFC